MGLFRIFFAGLNLSHVPWLLFEHRGLSEFTYATTTPALQLWDVINHSGQLAHLVFPLAPLGGVPWFTPGKLLSFFCSWVADGEVRCCSFVQDQGLLSLDTLRHIWSLPLDDWRCKQL